jgi:hypothetical protein
MLERLKDTETEDDIFEELNLNNVVKIILSFISKNDFEKCNLLNKVLICVWQLTEGDNLKPHPYTITRCINKVRGKATASDLRGRKPKVKQPHLKNEGYKQRKIEDCLSRSSHIIYFTKTTDSPHKQGISSIKETIIGWEINHDGVISYLETEYLYYCLRKQFINHGISVSARQNAFRKAIKDFFGELPKEEYDEKIRIYQDKLQTLIDQNYFEFAKDGYLITPTENRKSKEVAYHEYLYNQAIYKIEKKREQKQ